MDSAASTPKADTFDTIVIGAGIAGLAATLRLASNGLRVALLERHSHLGGKIRTVPSSAGPVAAGPTVLTLRHVFDELFETAGVTLDSRLTLIKQDIIARHFWTDGSSLDLFSDHERSMAAIEAFAGKPSAREFNQFCKRTSRLFQAFDLPVMQASKPNVTQLVAQVLRDPGLIPAISPLASLKQTLAKSFSDPRLRQLFGRYATYVGGVPSHAPAILALVWQAEVGGVWAVKGGTSALARTIADLARERGATILTSAHVARLQQTDAQTNTNTVHLENGRVLNAHSVVYAGDPRALATGALGPEYTTVAPQTLTTPRSLSARVLSFAATPLGPELVHHNVFFDADADAEFNSLMAGKLPQHPSFYICAMDRGLGTNPPETERFEIITNAPAKPNSLEDAETWHPKIIQKMARLGIRFQPTPTPLDITTETQFASMFPASLGALYGQSPHHLNANLKRPTARSGKPGLYLAGGGCHPGAGVPMAALSGKHAAEAILNDRISAFKSRPTATLGGTSTV